jgi:hypothetical protein
MRPPAGLELIAVGDASAIDAELARFVPEVERELLDRHSAALYAR